MQEKFAEWLSETPEHMCKTCAMPEVTALVDLWLDRKAKGKTSKSQNALFQYLRKHVSYKPGRDSLKRHIVVCRERVWNQIQGR